MLNTYKLQSEGEKRRLEFELKRMKEQNDQKSAETIEVSKRYDALVR